MGMTMERPTTMRAMVLERMGEPLRLRDDVPVPQPADGQVLLKVRACGVCRTDLHIVDGDLAAPELPRILGHQIVGTLAKLGEGVNGFRIGDRVGVPWLGYTCGTCRYCARGQENLCDNARFTGYDLDGGFAEYTVAHAKYCFHLPGGYGDTEVAPLLCAGLIGYRTYRLAGDNVERLGIYGFGSAAHIICQIAVHQGKKVYAFTREGDAEGQAFARSLGAVWAGPSTAEPPEKLDAALVFAPVGALYPAALRACAKGATVVSGGIHMSDIPSFPYSILWEERVMRSVANLTRRDGEELLAIAPQVPVKVTTEVRPLEEVNEVIDRIRDGSLEGSGVVEVIADCGIRNAE
jgi:propanol-preferring alcohol dehydrogenase